MNRKKIEKKKDLLIRIEPGRGHPSFLYAKIFFETPLFQNNSILSLLKCPTIETQICKENSNLKSILGDNVVVLRYLSQLL